MQRTSSLFALVLLLGSLATSAIAQTLQLTDADFVLGHATQLPSDEAAWKPQKLPDSWRQNHANADGTGWYRLRFEYRGGDAITAVYLPRLGMNAVVYLNGAFVGSDGSFGEPVSRNWNRPLYFLVPPGLLKQGSNTLTVGLRSFPFSQGTLHPVLVGPDALLRPDYDRLFFLRITLNQTITLVIAAIGFLMLSLWWRRRQDTTYGYFGLSAITWAVHSTNLYLRDVPIGNFHWEILIYATLPGFVALLMLSLLRFVGLQDRRLEVPLWVLLATGPALLPLTSPQSFLQVTDVLNALALLATMVMLVVLTLIGIRRRRTEVMLLAGTLWVSFLLGVHDWLMHSKILWYSDASSWRGGDTHLVHYAAPFIFLVIGWIMTARFVHVLNQYEILNRELENRVAAKHVELENNFAQLRTVEKDRAVLEERDRIMADMHDGLGGQLVSALRVVESNRTGQVDVPQLLRDCLDEMRLVINSLSSEYPDLLSILSDLRYRLAPRFAKAGMVLDWQVRDVPPIADVSSGTVLDIQRVVQEALTNVIKHAHAQRICVTTGVNETGDFAFVRIGDDGQGMVGKHRGRGLINMQKRAARIGGNMVIESQSTGTTVSLFLPLAHTPP